MFMTKNQKGMMEWGGKESTELKYRNEWKYCEKEADLLAVKERLSGILDYDFHAGEDGKYTIQSLYFDDYKNTCARDNVSGEGKRFKYRIRYYGDQAERLWLEKKEKKNSGCHKRKCVLSMQEYQSIIDGKVMDVFWGTQKLLLKEFCLDIVTRGFAPKVIISYQREAFVESIANIRITLDYNISASNEIGRFLSGNYFRIPVMEKEKHILEVKFDRVLPSYIKGVLQSNILLQQSFSKYYLGRLALQEKKVSMV
ncbi:polyphosphate polymerase domain-containing protein [Parablautia muri]|uniref:Polyphosphate polymerase domain-containing protein n=1 Tax=Parablautia muri TaxID=2320879 RepID=A0A9X5BCS2_9FIRM|nr:polyphosphate polymerase domain-containing protein [Parablautia muri]NBJ91297.1 polyphosphate polymerase domain-containing protein [Parablautia muri]